MTLGDDVAAALPEMQAQAESMMRDTCLVTTVTKVWDEAALDYVETVATVYEGPCRIRYRDTAVRLGEQGEQLFTSQDAVLSLPISEPTSGDVRKGHTVKVTASAGASRVGDTFTIGTFRGQTDASARRFPIEDIQ